MKVILTLLCVALLAIPLISQDVLNGSFEGVAPGPNVQSPPWSTCDPGSASTPDIFPGTWWNVDLPASHGDSYLNLVVKENEVTENIFGQIYPPLQANNCYQISLDLAVTDQFIFDHWGDTYYFTDPARLSLYLGNELCSIGTLVHEFNDIINTDWVTYSFIYTPSTEIYSIYLEADFIGDTPYYGHILVDNISIETPTDTVVTETLLVDIGTSIELSMTSMEGVEYEWSGSDISCSSCGETSILVSGDEVVHGIAYDPMTCTTEHYFYELIVNPIIPNVISPNNDGFNDRFVIQGLKPKTRLEIYSRWGQKVFESNRYDNRWDAEGLSEGTYYYILESKLLGEQFLRKGVLTIFR